MDYYLGLDSSTQSIKALVINPAKAEIVASSVVNFGKDLPAFGCPEGVFPNPDPLVKQSSPLMWLAALDLVLQRLQQTGIDMGAIRAISGAGQQHGSVYLNSTSDGILAGLSPDKTLADQVAPALSRQSSPVWMDSSTSVECREIEAAVGNRLQTDTGSPAIERFTGPQIRKFFKTDADGYYKTHRIHLVSSFMCSVLIGKHAPIDFGDGAGMNLLNLKTGNWDDGALNATAPGLRAKLPPVRPATDKAGGLHPYFAKYGLKTGIPVILWTGDNPSSLIGVGASEPGLAVISLGTSDTFFSAMPNMKTDPGGCGHIYGNPAGGFMSLICFKNGSLARERVKEECGVDWEFFNGPAMDIPSPGNDGNLTLSYYVPEITPPVLTPGVRRRGSEAFCQGRVSSATKIRSAVEGQVCSMRVLSEWIGDFKTIRVTGGASRSNGIVQLIADIFQADVQRIAVPDSAALGGAMRAAQAGGGIPLRTLADTFAASTSLVRPSPNSQNAFSACLKAYQSFIRDVRS